MKKEIIPFERVIVTSELLEKHWHWSKFGIQIGDEVTVDISSVKRNNILTTPKGEEKEDDPVDGSGPGSSQPPGSQPGKP